MLFRSLAFRTIVLSTIWAVLALFAIASVIAALYRQKAEENFERLLSAHLFNLIGAVGVSPQGQLEGFPELGDMRFSIPGSGWYWAVEPVSANLSGMLRSPSMTGEIAPLPVTESPYDSEFRRNYRIQGLGGEELEIAESEFELDDAGRAARFRIMGNRSELQAEIGVFESSLRLYLVLFGLGMIAINAVAIQLSLRPLGRVRAALAEVREGKALELTGEFPVEIEPLARETNALIENNRRIVERSRTQVGNLAHSLKTPLAVILNEGRAMGGAKGGMIAQQAEAMRMQVEHYLKRARMAASRDSVVFRTQAGEALARMVRVIAKLNPAINLQFSDDSCGALFAGEREDFEEIAGNLIENAMKWARSRVKVTLTPELHNGERWMCLSVDDDGPGIPDEKAREALERGKRLDETKPGTGLGLSIVAELVHEYGGQLALGRSGMGGLSVRATLRQPH